MKRFSVFASAAISLLGVTSCGQKPQLTFDPKKSTEFACRIVPDDQTYPVLEMAVYLQEASFPGSVKVKKGDVYLIMRETGAFILLNDNSKIAQTPQNEVNLKDEKNPLLQPDHEKELKALGDNARQLCFTNWPKTKLATNAR